MPRTPLAALLAALALAGCVSEKGEPVVREETVAALGPEPRGYRLELAAARDLSVINGSMRIALSNTTNRTLRSIWIRTWANAYGSCRERHVEVAVAQGGRDGRDAVGCTAKEIVLDQPLAPGKDHEVVLGLDIRVQDRFDRFGRTEDAVFLGSALPTLATAVGDRWNLPPYAERGEAWFSLPASWDGSIGKARGHSLVTTGRARCDGGGCSVSARRARDFMIVIGRLDETRRRVGSTTVRHWRPRSASAASARRSLDAAAASLPAFERFYGPYDRSELDIVDVRSKLAAGAGLAMEYPELILSPPAGNAIAHEIAHQWFAFILGNDPSKEPWLDESFAEFSAARLPRAVTGGDRLGDCSTRPGRPHRINPMTVWERTRGRAYTRQVYVGGACSLRRLQQELGEARFDTMMRDVVRRFRDRTWTSADFAAAVRRAAPPGFDADGFLREEQFIR